MADKDNLVSLIISIPQVSLFELMNADADDKEISLHDHISSLIQACGFGSMLDSAVRHCYLQVTLYALHCVTTALVIPRLTISPYLLCKLLINFADIDFLIIEEDLGICITALSAHSFLASYILHRTLVEDKEMTWLQRMFGESLRVATVARHLRDPVWMGPVIIDLFIYAALSRQQGDLPFAQAAYLMETLVVLMEAGHQNTLDNATFGEELTTLIQWP